MQGLVHGRSFTVASCVVMVAGCSAVIPASQDDAAHPIATTDPKSTPDTDSTWGRLNGDLFAGVALSQDQGDFSQTDFFLRFRGDTAWGQALADDARSVKDGGWNLQDFHSWMDVTLAPIPTEGISSTPGSTKEVIDSRKALTGTLAFDWRLWHWPAVGDHVLFVGPTIQGGIQSITNVSDAARQQGVDTANHFLAGGIRFGEYSEATAGKVNPRVYRSIDLMASSYENVGSQRLTINSMLCFKPGNSATTYFIGNRAILGRGPDDLAIFVGIQVNLSKLASAIDELLPSIVK